ncbi:MAG: rod shape-determining protein MreC [Syntrophus sp. (in: bacteria)]|nr:rod shape-determining protein MreC [Syntrophus sp. (in: bacteria)]
MKNTIFIVIAALLLIVSFLIFTNTAFLVKGYSGIKGGVSEVTGPALSLMGKPADLVRHIFNSYINLVGTKKENVQLKAKLEALQLDHQRIFEIENENRRLKAVLNLMDQQKNTMVAARVVGEDIKNWFKCIIIDKGRNSGIREKMPVVTAKGLVGQTVEINKWHTKVMVMNDINSSIDVYIEGKNTRGMLEGTGQNTLKLKYILKNDEIEIGDKLVTSGKDGIYPKGLQAGIVITVNRNKAGIFTDVDVMSFNNFKRLDEVLIVKKQ